MRSRTRRVLGVLAWLCCATAVVHADESTTPATDSAQPAEQKTQGETRLPEMVVEAPPVYSAASSDEISAERFELRPHTQMIQLLNQIPGLVVAQHQGGNKAPQYLIRGFDADHGTDFAVFVDDLPVNLPTHAHGQGYADINFVIPETVETYRLRKGPYFLEYGDFANAGALDIVTKEEFAENFVLAEGGSFDTQRYVIGASPKLGTAKTLIAAQALYTNGPFDHPENLSRYNGLAKITWNPTDVSKLTMQASIYQGDWDGSGQIPLREVSAGRLDRFGSIDPTEGGRTDRENVNVQYLVQPTERDEVAAQLYASRYELRLWSDFTFFKDTGLRFVQTPSGTIIDTRGHGAPGANYIPGDGIEQNDGRWLYGGRAHYGHTWEAFGFAVTSRVGVESRNDSIDVALYRQVRRDRFFTVNRVHVEERQFAGFVGNEILFSEWARFEFGVRADYFDFEGRNRLPDQGDDPNFQAVPISGRTSDHVFSPKANLVLTPLRDTDVYLDFGEGYHSNDARSALLGQGAELSPLVKSLGYELGSRTKQLDGKLDLAAAIWLLDLDSELVFSGDAGNQETGAAGNFVPAGSSQRWGIDFEARYQILRWLVADYDLAYADPRFTNGDAIPLAPTLLMNGGLTADVLPGLQVALRARYLDGRPAIEDRSLTARGWFLLDLIAQYRWRNVEVSLQALNLTNADWREAQFADMSCVRREVGGVRKNGTSNGCFAQPGDQNRGHVDPVTGLGADPANDIHFTPGNPFGAYVGVKLYF
jgi:outer membrane receptor protein involved in Fe transport